MGLNFLLNQLIIWICTDGFTGNMCMHNILVSKSHLARLIVHSTG
ncbi:hypothetical protein XBO1_290002 [Xenorhabdus bovienii str. oregonense]|uniref:Uncharacterized protein n=1 Tax=Xenorhabdus bovienii str. oregonense TaxID=1398202 RepID=A0A077P992_XENBV|nr:hypothetical protein XBO1_290002 [Xenorhabdus bovienii str. oregonense]